MDAILLVDRHLVFFEVEVGDALLEDTNEEVVGELVLIGEPSTRDGFKSGKESLIGLVVLGNGVEGVFSELIVVAVVAEGCGTLGEVAEIRLVLFLKKGVLSGEAIADWFEILGQDGTGYRD